MCLSNSAQDWHLGLQDLLFLYYYYFLFIISLKFLTKGVSNSWSYYFFASIFPPSLQESALCFWCLCYFYLFFFYFLLLLTFYFRIIIKINQRSFWNSIQRLHEGKVPSLSCSAPPQILPNYQRPKPLWSVGSWAG